MLSEWKPTPDEVQKLMNGGVFRITIYNGRGPVVPIMPEVVAR